MKKTVSTWRRFFVCLHHIKKNAQRLQHAACDHEDVEQGVSVAVFFAKAVDDRADGVGDAAQQQKDESAESQRVHHGLDGNDDAASPQTMPNSAHAQPG